MKKSTQTCVSSQEEILIKNKQKLSEVLELKSVFRKN